MDNHATESLVDLQVRAFLDRLASRTPAPGGGAVAGVAGALAAALGRMVIAYSVGRKSGDADRRVLGSFADQLEQADRRLRDLIDEDANAYAAYAELAQRKDGDLALEQARAVALERAMNVPLAISAAAGEVVAVLERAAGKTSRWMLSDLEVAGILAEATVRCAGCSVRVNAGNLGDAGRAREAEETQAMMEASTRQRLESLLAGIRSRTEPAG